MSLTLRVESEIVGKKMRQFYTSTLEEMKENARKIGPVISYADVFKLREEGFKSFLTKIDKEFQTESSKDIASLMVDYFKVRILGSDEVKKEIENAIQIL